MASPSTIYRKRTKVNYREDSERESKPVTATRKRTARRRKVIDYREDSEDSESESASAKDSSYSRESESDTPTKKKKERGLRKTKDVDYREDSEVSESEPVKDELAEGKESPLSKIRLPKNNKANSRNRGVSNSSDLTYLSENELKCSKLGLRYKIPLETLNTTTTPSNIDPDKSLLPRFIGSKAPWKSPRKRQASNDSGVVLSDIDEPVALQLKVYSTPSKRQKTKYSHVTLNNQFATLELSLNISTGDKATPEKQQPCVSPNMAPSYRNQNRRQNRTGVPEHDPHEGIPVRNWRREVVNVAPPPVQDSSASHNDIWAVELPHGMPKDSHLLPEHSLQLLRAARSGKIYKRPVPVEEEEADAEAVLSDKPEKKEDDTKDRGFSAKAWKPAPVTQERPEVGYLAKRRKGLTPKTTKSVQAIPTVIQTTVKRIDAAGNEYTQDFVVQPGQQVEGEVIATTVIPDPNAAPLGGAQPTPRRKPVVRRRAKGPGRGRKKKPAAPTIIPGAGQVAVAQVPNIEGESITPSVDGVKTENDEVTPSQHNEDTEMHDGSNAASDDESGDEGEDGEDGVEDEGLQGHHSLPLKPPQGSQGHHSLPLKPPRQASPEQISTSAMQETPNLGPVDMEMTGTEISSPHPMLSMDREGKSGSPLKHVVMAASMLISPLEPSASGDSIDQFSEVIPSQSGSPAHVEPVSLDEEMQQQVAEIASISPPLPPPEPTAVELQAAPEEAEAEEEHMLLDIVEESNLHSIEVEAPFMPPSEAPAAVNPPAQEPDPILAETTIEVAPAQQEPEQLDGAPVLEQKDVPEAVLDDVIDDDDDFPDLLGDLEKSLEKHAPQSPRPVSAPEAEVVLETQAETNTPTSGATEKIASPEKAVKEEPIPETGKKEEEEKELAPAVLQEEKEKEDEKEKGT